jgi:heat shock protein HslJ
VSAAPLPTRSHRPRRSGAVGLLLAGILAGLLAGCGDDEDAASTTTSAAQERTSTTGGDAVDADDLEATTWLLAQVVVGAEPTDAAPGADATLAFRADGALSGSTGCNRIVGSWAAGDDEGTITLTANATTMMACTDPALEAQETAVLAALTEVQSFREAGGRLELLDAAGFAVLAYDEVSQDLAGTSWHATAVNNGRGGVESNALTPGLALAFADDGTLTGSDGCNDLTGEWEAADGDITITLGASTLRACGDDVDALAGQYRVALEAATTYEVDGADLTLRDAQDATQARFTSSSGG